MRPKALRFLIAAVLVAGIAAMVLQRERIDAAAVAAWVQGAGAAAPLAFVALYALGTVLFLPGSVLTLAGGALFGPVWGTLYNLTGATLGATLAFLASRYLASDWVARRAGPRLRRLMDGVEAEGWRFVAFVRLVPLFPFNLLNYALGLTRIRLVHYVLASWVFMLPGAMAYTWLGYAGREAMAGGEGLVQKALVGLALLAAVAFLPRLAARWRLGPTLTVGELKAMLDAGRQVLVLDVRGRDEFEGELGHVPGARNVPLDELPRRLDELAERSGGPIAVVCRTDRRSAKAARVLAAAGFGDVRVVRGGMEAWRRAGYGTGAGGREAGVGARAEEVSP